MELRDYLKVVRRRWRVIVVSLIVVVALAALVTLQTTPQYQSQARLFVSTTDQSASEPTRAALFAIQRVSSYADLVNGQELAARVIDELDLDDDSPPPWPTKITATVVPDTVILEISATDPDPREAQRIAQATPASCTDVRQRARDAPGKSGRADQGERSSTPRACRPSRSRRSRCATSAWPSSSACCSASASPWCASCSTPASRAPTTSRDHRHPRARRHPVRQQRTQAAAAHRPRHPTRRGSRRSGSCAPTCSSSTWTAARRSSWSPARCPARARRAPPATPRWRCRPPASAPCSSTATCAARSSPGCSTSRAPSA